MADTPSFREVLVAARAREEWAWAHLVRAYSPRLLGYARSQGVRDPEDLVAVVFERLVTGIAAFSGDEDAFQRWMFRIAQHRLIDGRRAEGRRKDDPVAEPPEVETEDVATTVLRSVEEERLYERLRVLPEQQRAIVYMRYVLELGHREIAEMLDISVPAVKMGQRRALETLASRLDREH
jgi:RNA polymerase sigma-70 factor (ECF subfamily)